MSHVQKFKSHCKKMLFSIGNSRPGFTLIELLVVFSTIGLLSTTGIASFVSYSRTQALNQATLDVVTVLNLAKARARTQVKPPDAKSCGQNSNPNHNLLGYVVYIGNVVSPGTDDDITYYIEITCGDVLPYPIDDGKKTLPKGNTTKNIVFSQASIGKTFFFKVLSGATDFRGNISESDYIDILGYSSQCKRITVYDNGKILIKNGTTQSGACNVN